MRSNITEFPHPGGHGHEQKFKYPYLPGQQDNSNAYPQAKAVDQIPALCHAFPSPPPPSSQLDIDRCITFKTRRCAIVRFSTPHNIAAVLLSYNIMIVSVRPLFTWIEAYQNLKFICQTNDHTYIKP